MLKRPITVSSFIRSAHRASSIHDAMHCLKQYNKNRPYISWIKTKSKENKLTVTKISVNRMIAGMNTKEKPNVHKYDTYFTAEIGLKVWYRQKMGVNEQNHTNFIPQGGGLMMICDFIRFTVTDNVFINRAQGKRSDKKLFPIYLFVYFHLCHHHEHSCRLSCISYQESPRCLSLYSCRSRAREY